MTPIRVVAVGCPERQLLDVTGTALAREFSAPCTVADTVIDPTPTHHPERNQYHSTMLLELIGRWRDEGEIIVGVTNVDLFIPILTFVFGEAQVGGNAAVVSYHRLHQQFYGLPEDPSLLRERLAKEAVHELGHVFGLIHCDHYACAMAPSHSVEWLDLKGMSLCPDCRGALEWSSEGRRTSAAT